MQFLGNGHEVGQLPKLHAIDSTAGTIGGAPDSLVIRRDLRSPSGQNGVALTWANTAATTKSPEARAGRSAAGHDRPGRAGNRRVLQPGEALKEMT